MQENDPPLNRHRQCYSQNQNSTEKSANATRIAHNDQYMKVFASRMKFITRFDSFISSDILTNHMTL